MKMRMLRNFIPTQKKGFTARLMRESQSSLYPLSIIRIAELFGARRQPDRSVGPGLAGLGGQPPPLAGGGAPVLLRQLCRLSNPLLGMRNGRQRDTGQRQRGNPLNPKTHKAQGATVKAVKQWSGWLRGEEGGSKRSITPAIAIPDAQRGGGRGGTSRRKPH